MRNYSVLSLFTGCGGLDLGFQGNFSFLDRFYSKNNFNTQWANDIDAYACESFEKNFLKKIICDDIRNILNNNTKKNVFPETIDIVLGGFPCQDFSHAGKRKGFNSDRGTLYQSMCDVISITKPVLFIAENVKGLLTINNGQAIKTIIQDFENLGYHISYKLLLASDFGVPQKRERVIIVGTLKDYLPIYNFNDLEQEKSSSKINLSHAIGDLEDKPEGFISNHFWSKAKKNTGQGNNPVSQYDVGPTMRAEHHGNIEFHWNESRRLSAREAARIQSFPDNFIFYKSTSSAYKQIGNAVPPVFAWHIAQSIQRFLEKHLS